MSDNNIYESLNERITSIEFKLNALWDYNIRRARTETLYKKFGTESSPIVITDEVREIFKNIVPNLKSFYESVGVKLTYRELFILIDQQFGERIMKEICIPYEMAYDACVDIAVILCQET